MIPPVFGVIDKAPVNAIVSGRIFGFGVAPQNTTAPYVTWSVVSGLPINTLSDSPCGDNRRVQIDCWSLDQQQVLDLAEAVRDEMEKVTHQLLQRGPTKELDTKLYRYQMDFSFWTER